jgi:hypothetical protein
MDLRWDQGFITHQNLEKRLALQQELEQLTPIPVEALSNPFQTDLQDDVHRVQRDRIGIADCFR